MISTTPLAFKSVFDLPRRDLVAIYPYLNRKELEGKAPYEQLRQIDGVLQRLAAAAGMQ